MSERDANDQAQRGKEGAMTVGRLIELLKAFPSELMVVTSGYEGGYAQAGTPEGMHLVLNVNDAWYYGPHDTPWDGKPGAVLIRGSVS